MKRIYFLLIVPLAIFLTSCATSVYNLSESEKAPVISRTYDASFNTVYNCCLDLLQETGWIINNSDKESGSITTEYKLNDNVLTLSLLGQFRSKYSVRITKIDSKKSKVILTILSEREKRAGSWEPETITQSKYESMSKEFWEKLNNKIQ